MTVRGFDLSALEQERGLPDSEATPTTGIEVALLTGGIDKPYAFGLSTALVSRGIGIDFIGSDEIDAPELHRSSQLRFLNLRGNQNEAGFLTKVDRILRYYARLVRYSVGSTPKIFHILWNNRFQTIDRTILMLLYRLLGKKVVLTAHNVNAAKRDGRDSWLNRLTLRIQYRLADHVFVHTDKMKSELLADFGVHDRSATVIPFGINNAVPHTALTREQARTRLEVEPDEKVLLFFGRIGPYKGLEFLIDAFERLAKVDLRYRLVIAGKPKGGCQSYFNEIDRKIARDIDPGRVIRNIAFIPDSETELYFKAANVLILPYTEVFQSGVLFLGYSFGVPVIASDVGSMREGIVEGKTGLLCRPGDSRDLQRAIEEFFASDMSKDYEQRSQEIRTYANSQNSWDVVSQMTAQVYSKLLGAER